MRDEFDRDVESSSEYVPERFRFWTDSNSATAPFVIRLARKEWTEKLATPIYKILLRGDVEYIGVQVHPAGILSRLSDRYACIDLDIPLPDFSALWRTNFSREDIWPLLDTSSQSSTKLPSRVASKNWITFFDCEEEELEDGMTAALGEKLSELIRLHPVTVVRELSEAIKAERISARLASHILRWLGRLQDAPSFSLRLTALIENLASPSSITRDGAALGLSALGSKDAIPALRRAIDDESIPALRDDLEQVLKSLQLNS